MKGNLNLMNQKNQNKQRKLLFRITKKELKIQPFIGTGKGGQKRNKTMSCCRITHPESGAVSECTEQRSFFQNRSTALKRLVTKEKFIVWHKIKVAKMLGLMIDEEQWVNEQMNLKYIKCEIKKDGKWTQVQYDDIVDDNIQLNLNVLTKELEEHNV